MATLIRPNGEEITVFPENKRDFQLDELQCIVGGLIELVNTIDGKIMVINEEGKIKELPVNWKATELYQYGDYDLIAGDALICQEHEIL